MEIASSLREIKMFQFGKQHFIIEIEFQLKEIQTFLFDSETF
jgi:hypothetical protein